MGCVQASFLRPLSSLQRAPYLFSQTQHVLSPRSQPGLSLSCTTSQSCNSKLQFYHPGDHLVVSECYIATALSQPIIQLPRPKLQPSLAGAMSSLCKTGKLIHRTRKSHKTHGEVIGVMPDESSFIKTVAKPFRFSSATLLVSNHCQKSIVVCGKISIVSS